MGESLWNSNVLVGVMYGVGSFGLLRGGRVPVVRLRTRVVVTERLHGLWRGVLRGMKGAPATDYNMVKTLFYWNLCRIGVGEEVFFPRVGRYVAIGLKGRFDEVQKLI